MIPRSKKVKKVADPCLTKEQFLKEHNRLAPENLQATISLLSQFREEKASIFKDGDWYIDKFRRPFIMWLTYFLIKEEKKKH